MKNKDIAKQYFEQGYNCAQSVFLTYAHEFGIEKELALKLSSSFGGGMGRLREVCGAVSAMFAIVGLRYGYTENNNDELKAKHYELIQKLAQEFKNKHNTIICRELLGKEDEIITHVPLPRTEQYYEERPCSKFIQSACDILDKLNN